MKEQKPKEITEQKLRAIERWEGWTRTNCTMQEHIDDLRDYVADDEWAVKALEYLELQAEFRGEQQTALVISKIINKICQEEIKEAYKMKGITQRMYYASAVKNIQDKVEAEIKRLEGDKK